VVSAGKRLAQAKGVTDGISPIEMNGQSAVHAMLTIVEICCNQVLYAQAKEVLDGSLPIDIKGQDSRPCNAAK
jgi:hypothetical protein